MALEKILIEAFTDDTFSTATQANGEALSIEAFINPSSYKRVTQIGLAHKKLINDSAPSYFFQSIKDDSLSIGKIIVDGTGIIATRPKPPLDNVDNYIKKFRSVVCEYDGKEHTIPFLKISWGSLKFHCICSSLEVNYLLFNPDGSALRAELSLQVKATTDPESKTKIAGTSSPDLTHLVYVKAGQDLPLISYKIYKDSSYYLDLANKNNLNSIFAIFPGDKINCPPLKK